MDHSLRLTEAQNRDLQRHLFPGDGREAVALLLCGRRQGSERHIFTTRKVVPIPHESCASRQDGRVTWSTDFVDELIKEAFGKEQAIVKVHSHPGDSRKFSSLDDNSDRAFFESVASILGDGLCHASLVMLPSGEIFGRVVENGAIGDDLSSVLVVGDDLNIWTECRSRGREGFTLRQAQAFGQGTTSKLRSLAVAIVGCSGTGSIVAEQLARLGVGKLVLVDPDVVEEKNLNRILNSGKEDSYFKRYKVHAIASAIARMGFAQEVEPFPLNLATRDAVFAVAGCDVAFGCMDGVEGRHLLNRLATFYCLPYFDVGVRLDADGFGGISSVAGAVQYLQPGCSSLLSRGLYTMSQVEAEEMRRMNPELYARHRGEGYLRGIVEGRPAVISINMFFASLAVNEFLARIHPYRNRPNSEFAYVGGNLTEVALLTEPEGAECAVLKRHVGMGDVEPLLERSILS